MRTRRVNMGAVALLLLVMGVAALAGCSGEQGERDGLHSQVPDVVGQRLQSATDDLEAAGYTLGVVTWSDETDQPDGVVLEQAPIAGTSAARGAAIDLVVSGMPNTLSQ